MGTKLNAELQRPLWQDIWSRSERASGRRRLARSTINKSMREKGTSVGGRNITSLFCSILKCRLMLSIKRTINSASAEIIDDFLVAPTELRRWRHGPRFFGSNDAISSLECDKFLFRLLVKLFVPERLEITWKKISRRRRVSIRESADWRKST